MKLNEKPTVTTDNFEGAKRRKGWGALATGTVLGAVAGLTSGVWANRAAAAAAVASLCYVGSSSTGKPALMASDFTYLGAMRMPASGADTSWAPAGMTGRVVNGQTRFFVYGANNSGVIEIADPGSYSTDYTTAPRATLVTRWGNIYKGKDVSYDATGAVANFGLRTPGGLHWNESLKRLYWIFFDNYNVIGRADWNLGFTTLDDPSTAAATAYGPFRTVAHDTTGNSYGAWRCMYMWENPIDGSLMCGSSLQSGNSRSPWGPNAFGGGVWPDKNTPAGFGAPDIDLRDRYLMSYHMGIASTGSIGTNPIKAARRAYKPYVFDPVTGPATEVNPALYGGVGSWTQKDHLNGAIWLDLAGKQGVIFAASLVGSSVQNASSCAAGHVWYSNAGIGTYNCPHGCAPTGAGTGPTLTAYFPALMVYDASDLLDVKTGKMVDYTPDPVATIDITERGAKATQPGFSMNALGGFYFDPVRNYLFVAAAGADDRSGGPAPTTLIHVFRVNPN
jgi:hypothetical protein